MGVSEEWVTGRKYLTMEWRWSVPDTGLVEVTAIAKHNL